MLKCASWLVAAAMIVAPGFVWSTSPDDLHPYEMNLGAVDVTPAAELRLSGLNQGQPFVIQFHEPADGRTRQQLESAGVKIVRYLGGNGYLAHCDQPCSFALLHEPRVRAAFPLERRMKRSRVFDTDPDLRAWATSASPTRLHVRFLDSVSFDEAVALMTAVGVDVVSTDFSVLHSMMVDATWPVLQSILEVREVISVDPALPNVGPASVDVAHRVRADQVRSEPRFLGVDGTGQRIGIWDWFSQPHMEFEDRIIVDEVRWDEWGHGVLVSGPAASAGIEQPLSLGMAPGAELIWHSHDSNDNWSDMERVHRQLDMSIVNNSWSIHPGWFFDRLDGHPSWHGGLWAYGYYHDLTESADQVAFDTDLLVVFAAGNEVEVDYLGPHTHGNIYGNDGNTVVEDLHPPNPVFTSMAGASVGKNVVTVGGTTKEDDLVWFSSRGPTLDGRVKPDVMAPAIDIVTTSPDGGYTYSGGTSLAAPTVCGVAALLRELHERVHDFEISSVGLKNLLIHSARDMGLPGPDFTHGHGLVDAELAARIVRDAVFSPEQFASYRTPSGRRVPIEEPPVSGGSNDGEEGVGRVAALMVEDGIDHGGLRAFRFPVGSATDLRATLVWHDPPSGALVNDLDVRLESPDGRVIWPWVLDPDRPADEATTGVNRRDNVESVGVESPEQGWWTVVVDAHSVPLGPQHFSLIVSGSGGNIASERTDSGQIELLEFWATTSLDDESEPIPITAFEAGDRLNFFGRFALSDNPVYGHFNGFVSIGGGIYDADGETVVIATNGTHQWEDFEAGGVLDTGWIVPDELASGSYTCRLWLRLANGSFSELEVPISIQ